jgi:hypothetical protein
MLRQEARIPKRKFLLAARCQFPFFFVAAFTIWQRKHDALQSILLVLLALNLYKSNMIYSAEGQRRGVAAKFKTSIEYDEEGEG